MANTMYDVLMELPLLQGISREQVSSFLLKTHVEFINLEDGALIMKSGNAADSLLYFITGTVKVEWCNNTGDLSITFEVGPKNLLGAANLFGMRRETPYTIRAKGKVSLMRVSKEQYLTLLQSQSQPIYLLNCLNYLSLRAQKPYELLASTKDMGIMSMLRMWVCTVTPSNAENIAVHVTMQALSKYSNMNEDELRHSLFTLHHERVIELGMDTICIPSRTKLADNSF